MKDALSHVKLVEFGGYAAGPAIGKHLAAFGAKVVHVESEARPDGFRLQYPPFKDDVVGLNRSGCFSFFNDSKYGVTLDLKAPDGMQQALRLVDWADVLVENMRPGVMERLGLGAEAMRARKPSLVYLSTTNMGQSGPYAPHPGFGSQLSSLSGFTELIGDPDGPPNFLYGPYIDFVAVAFGGAAVLAALDRRRRTGEGATIDLSQYETGLQFIAPALLEHAATGKVARRNRNRDAVAVPHGAFLCRDGRWCVLSCWDQAEWQRFCQAAGLIPLLTDARFGDADARRAHEDALDHSIAAWARQLDASEVMRALQAARVHSGVVQTMRDLFADPQLEARQVWQAQAHPEMGVQRYRMLSYQLERTPGRVRSAAPCLGQHNDEVKALLADGEAEDQPLLAADAARN
jgi:crotonobetainyl-CoA:carnitine CoA-transferase CaiB-like acyl-CoA transferase